MNTSNQIDDGRMTTAEAADALQTLMREWHPDAVVSPRPDGSVLAISGGRVGVRSRFELADGLTFAQVYRIAQELRAEWEGMMPAP